MKKYIVITGGAGFVGSNLVRLFIKKTDFTIISLDNYSTGTKKKSYKIKKSNIFERRYKKYKKIII